MGLWKGPSLDFIVMDDNVKRCSRCDGGSATTCSMDPVPVQNNSHVSFGDTAKSKKT